MKKNKKRRHKSSRIDPTLSRGILAVILTMFAIIVALSFFQSAGWVGVMLDEYILSFLFGSIRYATPAIILIMAWFLIRDIKYNYRPTHLLGAFLFFLSLSSVMHLQFETIDMWRQALEGRGGGIFGMLAWPMREYLGVVASYVILIGVVIISIFLIFNTTIAAFIMIHRKIFETFGFIGKSIIIVIKKLFVPTSQKHKRKEYDESEDENEYDEEYDEDEEDEDEDEDEEESNKKSLFHKRRINHEDVEDEDEDKKNKHEEIDTSTNEDVWSKRVIVKNLPPTTLLSTKKSKPTSGDIKANAQTIHETFSEFNIDVTMGEVRVGPTVTQYSMKPSKGVKLSRITGLHNDIALALAAHPIRIEAPIPGKSLVGIEVPNEKAAMVTFKELIDAKEFNTRKHNLMVALGKDVAGKTWFGDLPRMPHLLIAGATGSGKTVCVNTILMSLLYQNTAETLRMIMVDPKRVELTLYNGIPHLLTPVITNTQKTVNALKWCIGEMDRRFEVFASVGSRDIGSYNSKHSKNKMPHIIFVIDELADLMATAANEVEAGIIRLAQMARAVGIHLIVATQRPSVDVITGLMKANIPGRIAFSVASQIDSRTILDTPGAEKLLGRGDMLYQTAELSKPVRIQGAFISEEELKNVVDYLKGDEEPEYDESIVGVQKSGTSNMFGGPSDDQDPLFDDAKEAILKGKKASASYLQRRLKVGYARAARILDELEDAGIIGPSQGAKPREILMTEKDIRSTMDAGQEHNVFKPPTQQEDDEIEYDKEELEEDELDEDEEDLDEDDENYDETDEDESEEYDDDNEEDDNPKSRFHY